MSPGVYEGGISISGPAVVTLLPGIYYMKGGGFTFGGQGALTGLGVAFSEGGSWVRRGLSVIFGLSIAFTASTFALTFLDFTGGAGF